MTPEIEKITSQCIKLYNPEKIFLFGSQAKKTVNKNSDIDLCIVINTENKRRLIADMYANIESDIPIDLVVYTPDEWTGCVHDSTSFAYDISVKGVELYAR